MTSGSPDAVQRARPVLDALTQKPEGNLQVVGDTCGAASDFKMINQVLCTAQITMAGYVVRVFHPISHSHLLDIDIQVSVRTSC